MRISNHKLMDHMTIEEDDRSIVRHTLVDDNDINDSKNKIKHEKEKND